MAQVKVSSVVKDFGQLRVIHGIDIDIADGEFAVLVGPSGCGKSTLLRMVAGLEDITGGEISIDGRVVNNLKSKERNIAMVFQSYALYPHMTVEKNMGFPLFLDRQPKEVIAEKVAEAAEILDLGALLDRYPGQLSGGQRQRVAMGRAIVREPSVFLFDEPLSNLDAKLRVQMRAEIKSLHQKLGTTIIYVTHDQIEAMTMADKIIVMNNGRVSQIGAPLELYDHPDNLFVATFIGSPAMNTLPATVVDATRLELADGAHFEIAHSLEPGRRIVLGMRPEDMRHGGSGPTITGPVRLVEPTGGEMLVTLDVAGSHFIAALRDRPRIDNGDTVTLNIDPGHLHFFDRESGGALSPMTGGTGKAN